MKDKKELHFQKPGGIAFYAGQISGLRPQVRQDVATCMVRT